MINNSRYATVTFISTENTTIHGFAGTFECVLYRDVVFSTVPHTHSPGGWECVCVYTWDCMREGECVCVCIGICRWECVCMYRHM